MDSPSTPCPSQAGAFPGQRGAVCGLALGQSSQPACLCQPPSPETQDKAGSRPDTARSLFISPSFPSFFSSLLLIHWGSLCPFFVSQSLLDSHFNLFLSTSYTFFVFLSFPFALPYKFMLCLFFISLSCLFYHLTLPELLLICRQCPEVLTHLHTHTHTHTHSGLQVSAIQLCTSTQTLPHSFQLTLHSHIRTHTVSSSPHTDKLLQFSHVNTHIAQLNTSLSHTHTYTPSLSLFYVCVCVCVCVTACLSSRRCVWAPHQTLCYPIKASASH